MKIFLDTPRTVVFKINCVTLKTFKMRNNFGVQLNIIKFQKRNQSGLGKTGNEYIGATKLPVL